MCREGQSRPRLRTQAHGQDIHAARVLQREGCPLDNLSRQHLARDNDPVRRGGRGVHGGACELPEPHPDEEGAGGGLQERNDNRRGRVSVSGQEEQGRLRFHVPGDHRPRAEGDGVDHHPLRIGRIGHEGDRYGRQQAAVRQIRGDHPPAPSVVLGMFPVASLHER